MWKSRNEILTFFKDFNFSLELAQIKTLLEHNFYFSRVEKWKIFKHKLKFWILFVSNSCHHKSISLSYTRPNAPLFSDLLCFLAVLIVTRGLLKTVMESQRGSKTEIFCINPFWIYKALEFKWARNVQRCLVSVKNALRQNKIKSNRKYS